ncbi:MAG TPA: selenium metabolism-associated LysR family transcriptional regulator [Blastocatellia bacterium]|nr:selenium metabolism-associated LysR family transcriptional regulator [Blastocatellia bacterium]
MRLDLNLLEVFCCVYKEGSFSRAAQKLRLSQPTVSGHIKNLEDHLGAKLFNRLPRQVVPTRAGEILYRRGQTIMSERESALQELKRFLNRIEGSLAICCSTIPGEYLMPQIVASFHELFPAVVIEMNVSDSQRVCDDVLSGKAELGFAGAKIETVGLEFRHFASDEMVLVVPDNPEWREVEAIGLDDLAAKPMLVREEGSGTRLAFEKRIGRSLGEFNVVGYFGSSNSIKGAIKSGLGVSVLSLLSIKSEIESGAFKAVKIDGMPALRRDFFAIFNKHLTLSPIAEEFLDFALHRPTSVERRPSAAPKQSNL